MITALILSAVLGQAAPASGDTVDAAALEGLEQAWNEAHLRGDADALDRLWADDLLVTVPRMPVFSRADALAVTRSGRVRFERYETSEVRARVYGDCGIVTGRLRRTRRMADRALEDDWQFTKVYLRREGRWRVVSFHASEAPQ